MSLQLSTRGRYGVRALCRVACLYEKGPVSIQTIVRKEKIPIRYLEQIMTRLRREGILESTRGPGGGYTLSRSPDQISLGEIIHILEGNIPVVWCTDEDREDHCSREQTCVPRTFWLKLSQTIQNILNNTTLKELINKNWKDIDLHSFLEKRITNQGKR